MFLLILESLNQYGERKQNFKFHYVSINSLVQIVHRSSCPCFKFHYVSINSNSIPKHIISAEEL